MNDIKFLKLMVEFAEERNGLVPAEETLKQLLVMMKDRIKEIEDAEQGFDTFINEQQ